MGSAKDILVKPITAQQGNALVKRVHYSGKVVNNSQLHLGVFYQGHLEGAMQFGPSLDKRKIQGLVSGTGWNEFIELNRLAFSDVLPRNSESRALSIAMKMLRKHAPHVKWIVSFADGTQCGDGTIYRASGFVLTSIKKNNQIWVAPDGLVTTRLVATDTRRPEHWRLIDAYAGARDSRTTVTKSKHIVNYHTEHKIPTAANGGGATMRPFIDAGFKPLEGYQLRYIYFLDPTARERLTVPILPFSEIERVGAGMYKGEKVSRAGSILVDATPDQGVEGGAAPTPALQYA